MLIERPSMKSFKFLDLINIEQYSIRTPPSIHHVCANQDANLTYSVCLRTVYIPLFLICSCICLMPFNVVVVIFAFVTFSGRVFEASSLC